MPKDERRMLLRVRFDKEREPRKDEKVGRVRDRYMPDSPRLEAQIADTGIFDTVIDDSLRVHMPHGMELCAQLIGCAENNAAARCR